MRQKSETRQTAVAKAIKDIRRATRKQYSAEEKIRIVLDGLRGEETIAELCRREGIAQSIYYKWSFVNFTVCIKLTFGVCVLPIETCSD